MVVQNESELRAHFFGGILDGIPHPDATQTRLNNLRDNLILERVLYHAKNTYKSVEDSRGTQSEICLSGNRKCFA